MFTNNKAKKNLIFATTNKKVYEKDRKRNQINKQFISVLLYRNNCRYTNDEILSN